MTETTSPKSESVGEWRERALKAEAACAAMRAIVGKYTREIDAGLPKSSAAGHHVLDTTDAGRPILDALEKAREALAYASKVVANDAENDRCRAALAAIEALGIRGGA